MRKLYLSKHYKTSYRQAMYTTFITFKNGENLSQQKKNFTTTV